MPLSRFYPPMPTCEREPACFQAQHGLGEVLTEGLSKGSSPPSAWNPAGSPTAGFPGPGHPRAQQRALGSGVGEK